MNFNDDDRLNVNVNRFENTNVWNADNRHRLVIPKLAFFSCLFGGSFLLQSFFPAAEASQNLKNFNKVQNDEAYIENIQAS